MLATKNPPAAAPAAFDPSSTKQQGVDAYTFAAEPRALQHRKKYRDLAEDQKSPPVNIMYDRRIHRGNTYASPALPLPDPVEIQKQQEMKRRLKAKKRAEARRRVRTPDPVEGRKHIDVQTDLYLEELSDKVPEAIAATQTDAFINRAPSPLYIPQKSGVDVATQIYQGELFDFDYEVTPILEVLVGKTLEQALMEVHEEEELAGLRAHQLKFEEMRNAELAEVQRLEDAERRRTEEKDRRLAEQLRILKEKQEVAEKIAARAFAQSYLNTLIPSVFESLATNGYFYDVVEKEVEISVLPWLTSEVEKNIERHILSRRIVDDLIRVHVRSFRQSNGVFDPLMQGYDQ
nr:Radial spoke head protein 3 [Polyrhizophydium stewartii]